MNQIKRLLLWVMYRPFILKLFFPKCYKAEHHTSVAKECSKPIPNKLQFSSSYHPTLFPYIKK